MSLLWGLAVSAGVLLFVFGTSCLIVLGLGVIMVFIGKLIRKAHIANVA